MSQNLMAYTVYLPLLLLSLPFSVSARYWEISDACPASISATVPWADPTFGSITAVHKALTSCPDVEALSIRFTEMVSGYNQHNLPFTWSGGDRYPPLKSLRLNGYFFSEGLLEPHQFIGYREIRSLTFEEEMARLRKQKPRSEWLEQRKNGFHSPQNVWQGPRARKEYEWYKRRVTLDWDYARKGDPPYKTYMELNSTQRNKTNLDLWLDAMDWTKLEHLAIDAWCSFRRACPDGGWQDRYETLDRLAPHLLSLSSFQSSDTGPETILPFLAALRPNSLKTLALTHDKIESTLDTIIQYHGQSLQHLELRSPFDGSENSTITPPQLLNLRSKAPNLSHLGIKLYRNGTWPKHHLAALSSISQLRSVALWLDIPSESHYREQNLILGFWKEAPPYEIGKVNYVEAPFRSFFEPDSDIEPLYDHVELQHENPTRRAAEPQYRTPIANETSAFHLFQHMRDIKVGRPLEELTVWVGDWTQSVFASTSFQVLRNNVRRYKIVCSLASERAGACEVEMEHRFR
ncbi:hypothetical protein DM02DRAFT_114497 [Periconia macrospinosa]|uniref:Uncharacterized protein n=1 Tax=Periconia macrospinosa TaxID=97972 RepID=A0A2V1DET4_9PLEO|nr:hypothetical protein DM02DRAFT_114497 [Periconia macrospinosa]